MTFDPDWKETRQNKIDRTCDQYVRGLIGRTSLRVMLSIFKCDEDEQRRLIEQCDKAKNAVAA